MIVIIMSVFLTWSAVLGSEFVNWDDGFLLVNNQAYRGLGFSHLRWMFTTNLAGHYQPLTWLSYAVDYSIWGGVNSTGVHLTNLLLHLATAICLLFVIIRVLQAAMPTHDKSSIMTGATFATLLFALHPLRVESVAWATERRDVLSGLLIMITLIFYLRAVQDRKSGSQGKHFCLALVCFCVSLLCKASGMILPGVLIILDIYPLRRFARCCSTFDECSSTGACHSAHITEHTQSKANKSNENRTPNARGISTNTVDSFQRCLFEKLAFLMPASLIALAAIWAQHGAGALRTSTEHPYTLRIAQAFYGLFFYVWKTVWPTGLIPLYEQRVDATPWDTTYLLSALFVLVFTIAAWLYRKKRPALLAAWLCYIVILLPMLGFAQSGPQVVADRYSYLACIPWAILAGAFITAAWRSTINSSMANPKPDRPAAKPKRPSDTIRAGGATLSLLGSRRRAITAIICIGLLSTLAFLTKQQAMIWHDSIALWNATIKQAPDTGTAHANLASALNRRGKHELAKQHGLRALEILPGNRVAHIAVASASSSLGDYFTAKQHLDIALTIRPTDPNTLASLVAVESKLGNLSAALSHCQKLIALQPLDGNWHATLGTLLAKENRDTDAIESFQKALQLNPELTDARYRLAILLERSGQIEDAIALLESGLRNNKIQIDQASRDRWKQHITKLRQGKPPPSHPPPD